jgi:SapC
MATPPTEKTQLHTQLVALDREAHRKLRLARHVQEDYSVTAGMNALFVNAVEFVDVCREYPIVFIKAGTEMNGALPKDVAPMAVLGLTRGENLYLEGTRWTADYVPAQLRAYPFAMARVSEERYVVCFDQAWTGFSEEQGDALFTEAGEPTELTQGVQQFIEQLEAEMQRTRAFGARLLELGLLQEMRFDATLPSGEKLQVDGFLAIDEKKLAELPDATVLELHKSGILMLIHCQLVSMGNMRRLAERRGRPA